MLTQQLPPAATVAVLSIWGLMYNKLSMVRVEHGTEHMVLIVAMNIWY